MIWLRWHTSIIKELLVKTSLVVSPMWSGKPIRKLWVCLLLEDYISFLAFIFHPVILFMSSSLFTGPLLRARSDDFSCLNFLNRCRRCLSYLKTTHKMSWPHLPTEFTRTSNVEVYSVKEKPQTTRNDVTNLYHTLKCYLNIRHDRRQSKTPWKNSSRKRCLCIMRDR